MKRVGLVLALALLAAAAPASAQTPTPPSAPTLAFSIGNGIRDSHRTWELTGEAVQIRGVLRPYVPGQKVRFDLLSGGRHVATKVVHVGARGIFRLKLVPHRAGNYTIRATHAATPQQAAATATQKFGAIAGDGHHGGEDVRLLQVGLARLGYATSMGGRWDSATALAVLTFRSVNNLSRNSTADRGVFLRLFRGQGGYRLRYPRAGRHVEFSWTHQVLILADHGRPQLMFHTSSGKPSTPTVFGHFHFYSKVPGTLPDGMFDSNFFIGGYAVHGYPSVPTYPASHGCIRVNNLNAPEIFAWIKIGMSIYSYR